jgi:hypothetical protein
MSRRGVQWPNLPLRYCTAGCGHSSSVQTSRGGYLQHRSCQENSALEHRVLQSPGAPVDGAQGGLRAAVGGAPGGTISSCANGSGCGRVSGSTHQTTVALLHGEAHSVSGNLALTCRAVPHMLSHRNTGDEMRREGPADRSPSACRTSSARALSGEPRALRVQTK